MTLSTDQRRASVDEHARHIGALISPALAWTAESVGIADALGRVTAEAVASPVDLPLFRNSQMDGFAARAADLPGSFIVVGEIAARPATPPALEPGTVVRIMTGAVVPDGADVVVPVEAAESDAVETTATAWCCRASTSGTYVRERGSDVRAGDVLLPAGIRLASRHLAVLAAAGITTVAVRSRVRIAIVTTGAELVEPGDDADASARSSIRTASPWMPRPAQPARSSRAAQPSPMTRPRSSPR